MEFNTLIKERYSCKKFQIDKLVDNAIITRILESGRLAPTAKNNQEQHLYVITGEALSIIDKATPCRYNAPVVIVVAYNTKNTFIYPGEKRDSGIEDASIVATHLMLSAYNEGVDSCWVNFFNPSELKSLLNINPDEEILMILDLGYKATEINKSLNHNKRKSLDETVTYISHIA